MKKASLVEVVLNDIIQLYWEQGYTVNEIILPKEFKEQLLKKKVRKYVEGDLKTMDVYENNHSGLVKIFDSPSKHFQILVEPK